MKLALFLSLFSFSASAAPVITSVLPTSGPVAGGTEVTIHGSGFAELCSPVIDPCLPALPRVSFGNIAAASVRLIDATTLVAVTPAHLPVTVPLFISQADGTSRLDNAFTFTGGPGDAFERVLIPIFLPTIDGAFGSKFVTEFHISNRGPAVLPVHGLFACAILCPPTDYVDSPFLVAVNGDVTQAVFTGDPGRLIWIPKTAMPQFVANLRVFDTSRAAESAGSEIPLARDADFRSDSIQLVGVPMDARFRVKLRIYSADPDASFVSVTVNGVRFDVVLRAGDNGIFTPAYGEVAAFAPAFRGEITVAPLAPGARIWAFATVTNNETQQITVISPQ